MKYKKIVFAGLLIAGVGLCIGGVFVAPLMPIGASLLVGAVAVGQLEQRPGSRENRHRQNESPSSNDQQSDSSGENVEVNVRIDGAHFHRHKKASVEVSRHEQDNPDHSNDADEKTAKTKPRHKL